MASRTTDTDSLRNVIAGGTAFFGVAGLLAPRTLARAYGVAAPSPEFVLMARYWGSRNLCLAALAVMAEPGAPRRTFLTAAASMSGADVAVSLTARDLPATTRLMAATTSALFAAGQLYASMQEG